ncbi:MAG: NAD(P)H-binding protein [Frankiaceae bacterium]|nr:NAD(P)H-binding protein [Frankiaceae bacterium]
MSVVVVTGATGTLGRVLVPALHAAGHHVRAMTRTAGRVRSSYEVVADVLDPSTLGPALEGADCVVHLASNPRKDTRRTEVDGTRNVLAARPPGASLIYLSIVGCDRTPFPYYRAKTAAEALVRAAPDGYVVRATQFHSLAGFMTKPRVLGRSVVPRGALMQPVAEDFVASVLVGAVGDPGGAPAEIGGPEQLTMAEIARRVHGSHVISLPIPGRFVAAVRRGSLLAGPDAVTGGAPLGAV